MNKNIEAILAETKKLAMSLVADIFLILNKKSYLGLIFIAASFTLAVLIVWGPVYLLLFILVFVFLIMLFWKTEESLSALIFYLPFQIALNITKTIDLASSRLLIVVLFVIWIFKSLAKKKLGVPYSIITWLILIFLALATLSAYFSIDQEKSAIRLLFFFSIFPLYFITAEFVNFTAKIAKIIYVLLFSASIAGIAGIVQFISQFIFGIDPIMNFWSKNIAYLFYGQSFGRVVVTNPSWLVNVGGETFFRAISFFPDPHMFSFYLGLVAPLALCLLIFSNIFSFSFFQKQMLCISNIIIFLALGLTFSRAGYVGAFFGVATVIILGWRFFSKRARFTFITIILFGAIAIFSSSNIVVSRFFSSFNPSEGSNSERLLNWRQSFRIIENDPITGAGVGAYAEALYARAPLRSSVTAHNTYLDIAAEMGLPALLVWLAILITTMRNLFLISISGEHGLSKEKIISIGLAGAFVWFSVQLIFDTAIYSPTVLAILMVYLAISVNLRKQTIKNF